ncbi:GD17074 [Drosophila simulans]|uniref:GD17074 n=1 Tax=Drosophila simulans TaxID=7240 RepID=B4R3N5_DROSI|nr:GD17074 [Drosophila simulans]
MSQSGSWQGSRTIVGGRRTRQDAPRGELTPPKMPMPMPMPMTTQQDIQDSRLGTEEPGARTQDTGHGTQDPRPSNQEQTLWAENTACLCHVFHISPLCR